MVLDIVNRNKMIIPTQHTPVASAAGSSSRHERLPPSSNHMLNHQNKVAPASAKVLTSATPPTRWSHGCTAFVTAPVSTNAVSQPSRLGRSFQPRPGTSNACSYNSCTPRARPSPANRTKTQLKPVPVDEVCFADVSE